MFMRRAQGTFEYLVLMAGILAIAIIAFFILRNSASSSSANVDLSNCKTQLAVISACFYSNGTWKSGDPTLYDALENGLDLKCTVSKGGFSGTQWDDPGSEDKFKCGDGPPQ